MAALRDRHFPHIRIHGISLIPSNHCRPFRMRPRFARVLRRYAEADRVNLFTEVAFPDGTSVQRVQPSGKDPDTPHGRCVAKATYGYAENAYREFVLQYGSIAMALRHNGDKSGRNGFSRVVGGFRAKHRRRLQVAVCKRAGVRAFLEEYLNLAKSDPMAYASPAERMLAAIGEPEVVDTRNDPRLSACFPTGPSGAIQRSRSSTAWRT